MSYRHTTCKPLQTRQATEEPPPHLTTLRLSLHPTALQVAPASDVHVNHSRVDHASYHSCSSCLVVDCFKEHDASQQQQCRAERREITQVHVTGAQSPATCWRMALVNYRRRDGFVCRMVETEGGVDKNKKKNKKNRKSLTEVVRGKPGGKITQKHRGGDNCLNPSNHVDIIMSTRE